LGALLSANSFAWFPWADDERFAGFSKLLRWDPLKAEPGTHARRSIYVRNMSETPSQLQSRRGHPPERSLSEASRVASFQRAKFNGDPAPRRITRLLADLVADYAADDRASNRTDCATAC